MLVYDFLDKDYDRSGYAEVFSEQLSGEINSLTNVMKIVIDDLCKQLKNENFLKKQEASNELDVELMKKMEAFISDSTNYMDDLFAACYMALLYNDPANCLYVEKFDPQVRKKMQSAINHNGKHVGNNPLHPLDGDVYENYPVPLFYNDLVGNLVMIPGGCAEYHKAILDPKYFKIHDLSEKNYSYDNYTRYSVTKTYPVWKKVAKSSVENLLMMEFSLGYGCACYMFEKLSWVKTENSLFAWEEFIKAGREFPHFFMRKQLLGMLFDWFEKNDYQIMDAVKLNRLTDSACELFDNVTEMIKVRLIRSLELFSMLMWGEGKQSLRNVKMEEDEKCIFQKCLTSAWKKYFDNKLVYCKCIEPLIGEGWYDVEDYKECFEQVYLTQETLEHLGLADLATIELEVPRNSSEWNADGIVPVDDNCKYTIRCKRPYNAIGWKLWEYASKELLSNPTPDTAEECANLVEKKIAHRFLEMKNNNEIILANKQVKATDSNKKVKALYLYGYIQKYFVSSYPKNVDS